MFFDWVTTTKVLSPSV